MAKQDIFDDETFFEGYRKIRDNEANANILFEMPALFSLLPDMEGKTVLDLGCGFGEHCIEYIRRGAARVVGIDISKKMLEIARKENSDPRIEYIEMPMEDIGMMKTKFDIVTSSLAIHYVEDFSGVTSSIYELLSDGGIFLFSQEHPLSTCYSGNADRWIRDESGNKQYLKLENYSREGEKEYRWFVDGVIKYHRMFSTIVNSLIQTGFILERMEEPLPDEDILERFPQHSDLFHKPDFLIIRARR
ncbi:MAG: class I SAM-dependent methyltransferase [Eubacteriaceae bacterium]|nr:class I SAM-dependent methyltransferase [Eubacteriaceae bacterium]MBR5995719.1 class I SAM-dependent methyltransferase [Eubacteriaceae bacterium]